MPKKSVEPCYRSAPGEWQQVKRGRGLFSDPEFEYPLALLIKHDDKMIFAYAIQEEVYEDYAITHLGLALNGTLGDLVVDEEIDIYRAMLDYRAEVYEIDIHGGKSARHASMRHAPRVLMEHHYPSPGAVYSDFDERAMPATQAA
jgi:hypothetical protein